VTRFVIETDDLHKEYDGIAAVDHLKLNIPQGEVFGLLGHNGAGKTTVLHMLTTLSPPSSGHAKIAGCDIKIDPLGVRREIGYVPENIRLYDTLTTFENLLFFARLSQLEDPQDRVNEVLEFLGIEELSHRRVGAFSKGMRQRVGIAQAILHRPKVLFLDEPSSGLDPMGMKMLRDLIARLNGEFGMTIFMNTHLISEVAKICTSIGVLNHGKLVFHDRMEAVISKFGDDNSLEELYLSVIPTLGNGRAA